MRRLMFFLFATLLLAFGQQVTYAQDGQNDILSQSYYADKTNALTYEEAKSVAFTPYQGLLTGGFSKGAYWVRLDIRANTRGVVLKLRPSFLNEITLYDPASSRSPRTTGSSYPVAESDIETNSLNFALSPSAQNRAVYLRIKSDSSYLLYVDAMPLVEFERSELTDHMIYTGYIVLTLILAVWMFITWLMHREKVIGVFALQQLIAVAHGFTRSGFARTYLDQYMSDVLISNISNGIVVFYALVGIVLNKLLLQEYGMKRLFRFILNAAITCSVGLVALYLSGYQQMALAINTPLLLFVMVWFWICALYGTDASQSLEVSYGIQIKALRLYYTFNLLLWLVTLLPFMGFLSTGRTAFYLILAYSITSSLAFFTLLQYRARWLLRNEVARASTLEADATQERQRREEQGMLMAMLSHEIKTPLSILKLVMDEKVAGSDLEGHANRAVSNINFIVNRCLQLGKLDAKAIQLNPTHFHAEEFLIGLLNDCQDATRVKVVVTDVLYIHTDREILRVVMSNLLENALKYGDQAQPVELEALAVSENGIKGVRINVRNTVGALGIPDADHVFKKYYRNTQATKVAGSGLGLFLVHELVDVLGGKITYQLDNDKVLFSVWMPV